MSLFGVAQRAMSAQLVRMNAAASNLANAGSVTGTEAEAYRPIRPVFAEQYDKASGLSTVNVSGTLRSTAAPVKQYAPDHPLADSERQHSGPPRSMRMPRWSRCSMPRASTRTWSKPCPPPSS
jgi:flagellar basal body rod protein FlgC